MNEFPYEPEQFEPVNVPAPQFPEASGGNALLDRLALALSQMQSPGASGAPGDVFGANLVAGLAQGFSGPRLARMQEKKTLNEHLRENQQRTNEFNMKATQEARQERYRGLREDRKAAATDARTAAQAKVKSDEDAVREKRRQFEADRDYKLKSTALAQSGAATKAASKPPTEFQARAQFFHSRAKEAAINAEANGLEGRVLKKAWSLQAPPALQGDPDVREYWRSMEAFTLALNRLESGAAIAPTEFAKVRQLYFVTPGDKEADVQSKAKMRAALIDNLSRLQTPGVQQEQAAAGNMITPAQLWEP